MVVHRTIRSYLWPAAGMGLGLRATRRRTESPAALTAYPDGEACAELMLVVGTDEGGLPHPDWQENLANALKLQALI